MNDTNKLNLLIAFFLSIIALVAGALLMVPGGFRVYHDDGIYVSTAKALASGDGLINLPDEPFQTKYTPVYPGMLAVIWKFWPSFPDNLLLMQWLTILMMAMSVGFAYYYVTVHHYFSPLTALSAGLLCVTSSYFLCFGTILLSEMPFAFFVRHSAVGLGAFYTRRINTDILSVVSGFSTHTPFSNTLSGCSPCTRCFDSSLVFSSSLMDNRCWVHLAGPCLVYLGSYPKSGYKPVSLLLYQLR